MSIADGTAVIYYMLLLLLLLLLLYIAWMDLETCRSLTVLQ